MARPERLPFALLVAVLASLALAAPSVGCESRVDVGAFLPSSDAASTIDVGSPADDASCAALDGGVTCQESLAEFCGRANSVCSAWSAQQAAPICPDGYLQTVSMGACDGYDDIIVWSATDTSVRVYYYAPGVDQLVAVVDWDNTGGAPVPTCIGGPSCFAPPCASCDCPYLPASRCAYPPDD